MEFFGGVSSTHLLVGVVCEEYSCRYSKTAGVFGGPANGRPGPVRGFCLLVAGSIPDVEQVHWLVSKVVLTFVVWFFFLSRARFFWSVRFPAVSFPPGPPNTWRIATKASEFTSTLRASSLRPHRSRRVVDVTIFVAFGSSSKKQTYFIALMKGAGLCLPGLVRVPWPRGPNRFTIYPVWR